eukprot:4411521-Pyramimonas_sp.AAC.1
MHYVKVTIFGIMWACVGVLAGCMQAMYLFREFVREAHAWLNATRGSMTPPQHAVALQRGLGGLSQHTGHE